MWDAFLWRVLGNDEDLYRYARPTGSANLLTVRDHRTGAALLCGLARMARASSARFSRNCSGITGLSSVPSLS